MDKDVEEAYSEDQHNSFLQLDYMHGNQIGRPARESSVEMVDYMLNNTPPHPQVSLDKLSFADVMQLADFGPKLALNQTKISDDDGYFPPLLLPSPPLVGRKQGEEEEEEARVSENASSVQQLGFAGRGHRVECGEGKNRRKRPRAMKTSEEVESQRMTHIAVERNRRKQMNEHLRVLRSLMPSSYVQRGDQASIIGGAIEFVRELEQLLQCLESQKRRRIFGGSETPRAMGGDVPPLSMQGQQQQPFFPPLPMPNGNQMTLPEFDPSGLQEETAENKSCLADIEVRLLGFDAMIKILSRRRPGQLLKTIAALEEMQFNILHTNITTIEQTVLYSFNVKITGETRCSAEDIANSVHQILSFIEGNAL